MKIKLNITKTKDVEQEKTICGISEIMETLGKYQIIQYILICIPIIFVAMINLNYVFVVGNPGYRCRVDECEDTNSTAQFPSWWPDVNIDRCSKPVLKSGDIVCTNNSFTGELTKCYRWIYEGNDTVFAELNLACQPWKSSLIGTIHTLGTLISILIWGWMSDKKNTNRFGRKPILLFCIVGGCIGNIKTFATSYYMYAMMEVLEALITGGPYAVAVILFVEISGQKYRLLSAFIIAFGNYFGESLLACVAMFVPYWKSIIYTINGPCIIFVVYAFFINESPRWQIVSGRIENAKITMKQIAHMNKIHINYEELANIDENSLKEKFNIKRYDVKESYMDVFKSKEVIKRLLVAGMCRFTVGLVYFGMMMNSVWLPGNKFENFILASVISFPGDLICLLLLHKLGRKIPLMIGYSLSGALCIVTAFIPENYFSLKLTFFLLGKMIIAMCFTGAIIYSTELFPTSVRGSLVGLTSVCTRLGATLAPLTVAMNTISQQLPYIVFFFCALVTSGLLILMPETKDLPLFDTIKQVENYNNNKSPIERGSSNRAGERT